MPYLTIDGITIPVAEASPRLSFDAIGADARSIGGTYLPARRASKRKWDCKTIPLTELDAWALEAWLSRVVRPSLTASPYATTAGYLPVIATGINQDAAGAPTGEASQHLSYTPTSGEIELVSSTATPFAGFVEAWSFATWIKGGVTADHVSTILGLPGPSLTISAAGVVSWSAPSLVGVSLADGLWHHVAVAAYLDSASVGHYSLFCDGVLSATATAATSVTAWQSLQDLVNVQLYSYDVAGSSPQELHTYPGQVYQPLFVPGPMTATQCLALYNARIGVVLGAWPQRRICGGIVGGRVVTGYVTVEGSEPVDFVQAGTFQNGRVVSFSISES